jgi:hypothetical protein
MSASFLIAALCKIGWDAYSVKKWLKGLILEYSDIASYAWLGDFTLLKYSRHETLKRPWASPGNREIAMKYFKVIRAREELTRLNVEICRLAAWVDNEDSQLASVASAIACSNPALGAEINSLALARRLINDVHRTRLAAIYRLKGYTGSKPESHVADGADSEGNLGTSTPATAEEDDSLSDEMLRLGDFFDSINWFSHYLYFLLLSFSSPMNSPRSIVPKRKKNGRKPSIFDGDRELVVADDEHDVVLDVGNVVEVCLTGSHALLMCHMALPAYNGRWLKTIYRREVESTKTPLIAGASAGVAYNEERRLTRRSQSSQTLA